MSVLQTQISSPAFHHVHWPAGRGSSEPTDESRNFFLWSCKHLFAQTGWAQAYHLDFRDLEPGWIMTVNLVNLPAYLSTGLAPSVPLSNSSAAVFVASWRTLSRPQQLIMTLFCRWLSYGMVDRHTRLLSPSLAILWPFSTQATWIVWCRCKQLCRPRIYQPRFDDDVT